jgi:hypothetical protein
VSDRDCPLVTLAYGTYVARAGVLPACHGVGDPAGRAVACGALTGLPNFRGCAAADAPSAHFGFSGSTEFGKLAF